MDARSIAATAANGGILTPASSLNVKYTPSAYKFDDTVYKNRLYKGFGDPKPEEELVFGPNIRDWPEMPALSDDLILKVASVIDDPVTTTDELIPSGETSSYRSNPEALSEFTLSRKDPAYVGRAKAASLDNMSAEDKVALEALTGGRDVSFGSVVFAHNPGDGSAREQAASCQKVLGGYANIADEYATKRYRSNLINWGLLPLLRKSDFKLEVGNFVYLPDMRKVVANGDSEFKAYIIRGGKAEEITLGMAPLTEDEKQIILAGCLMNYWKNK
jgi:aconitate hydratase